MKSITCSSIFKLLFAELNIRISYENIKAIKIKLVFFKQENISLLHILQIKGAPKN